MRRMTAKFERRAEDLQENMQHLGKLRQRVERLPNALRGNAWMHHGIVEDDAVLPLHVLHAHTLVNKRGWIHMLAKGKMTLRVFSVMAAQREKYGWEYIKEHDMEKFVPWYECQMLHNAHPINSAPSPDLLANLKSSMHITHAVCTGPHLTSTYANDSGHVPKPPSKVGKARFLWVARDSPPTYKYMLAVWSGMLADTHADPHRTVIAIHGEYTEAVAHMTQWSMRFGVFGFDLHTVPTNTIHTVHGFPISRIAPFPMLILIPKMATIFECLVKPPAEFTQCMRRRAHTIRSVNRYFAELNRFGDVSGINFQALISGIREN